MVQYALPPYQKRNLTRVANQVVGYVTYGWAPHDAEKGCVFRVFIAHDLNVYFRGVAQLHKRWVGGNTNIADYQKFEAVSWMKTLWIANNAIDKIDDAVVLASSDDHSPQKRVPAGAIMFPCRIPDFMGGELVNVIFVISGLDQWSDEAAVVEIANFMRSVYKWQIRIAHLQRIIRRSGNQVFPESAWGKI